MAINVTIAFSNLLLANGICKLLEGDKDIKVIDVLKVGTRCHEKVRLLKPDIVLVDFLTLYNGFEETKANGKVKFILFDTTCGEENINCAILKKGVSGVLPVNATLASLKKVIRTVSRGGFCLGKKPIDFELPIKDINRQYKEVSTITDHWIQKYLQDAQIVAFGTFMVAFVAILAIAI